jgi:cation:H+ antiporter
MLGVILVAAEPSTNALEHLCERLKILAGVTGSLFAAVGTVLPKTLVGLVAIACGASEEAPSTKRSASARFSVQR